jgi:hypothetical protein
MKLFLTCATLTFLALGCTTDPTPPPTPAPGGVTSVDEASRVGDVSTAGATALSGVVTHAVNCDHPPTCALFCRCEENECLAEGNSLQLCSEEYTECFHGICLH